MSIFEQIVFDDGDFDTEWYQSIDRQMSQEGRPHIFVRKLRERRHSHKILDRRDNPSWYISVDEFASAYAAAEFAALFGLHLDMHVTVDFGDHTATLTRSVAETVAVIADPSPPPRTAGSEGSATHGDPLLACIRPRRASRTRGLIPCPCPCPCRCLEPVSVPGPGPGGPD